MVKRKKRNPQKRLKIYYERDSYEFNFEATIGDVTHCCNEMKNSLETYFRLGFYFDEEEPSLLLGHPSVVKIQFCPFCGAPITIKMARL